MTGPLVSIVVPAYNRAGLVETTVASLLDQDYEPLEVIALDDGSQDETAAVLARIAERTDGDRFRWDRHDNVGQAATINRGFELARGELLGYLSSDDYMLPGAVSRLVAAAEEHPEADVVYPDFLVVDEADHVTNTVRCLQHTFADSLRWALCIPGVGALMRRRCYERVGGWDPRYHYSPDYEWWLRAGEAAFVRVPEPLGAWRSHGGSITANDFGVADVRRRLDERLLMLDEIFARDDLPPDVRKVENEAYSTTLIEMAALLDQEGLGASDRRFALEDRVGVHSSDRGREAMRESHLWHQRMHRFAEHRATAAEYRLGQLELSVEALRTTAREREAQAALLEAEVERLRAERSARRRPPWLRVARKLTPAPLRPRLGAFVHRIRHPRRA